MKITVLWNVKLCNDGQVPLSWRNSLPSSSNDLHSHCHENLKSHIVILHREDNLQSSTLKMEAVDSSKLQVVIYQTILSYIFGGTTMRISDLTLIFMLQV
jgi:hypothetical protein